MSRDWKAESEALQDVRGMLEGVDVGEELRGELLATVIGAREASSGKRCEKNAPFIFYLDSRKVGHIVQGCCNDWNCPRCGVIRAKEEYGRIVHGSRTLAEKGDKLYFHTITCRGRELAFEDAEKGYMEWTNRLLTACRARSKKQGGEWAYVQVTERQQRLHPHSHLITTFLPDDAMPTFKTVNGPDGEYQRSVLVSEWFVKRNVSAGLGPQCEITEVRNAAAVAVYVAKYLFKSAMLTKWPKGWRRVRYSQSWPKLPDLREGEDNLAFPLLSPLDWQNVVSLRVAVRADSEETAAIARAHGVHGCDCAPLSEIKERVNHEYQTSY